MATRGLEIRRSFRLTSNAQLNSAKREVLITTAGAYRDEIVRNMKKPADPGYGFGRGLVSGRMATAVVIGPPTISPSGKSDSVIVKLDSEKVPYARWQELGTGVRSEDPDSPKQVIVPKTGKYMHWVQKGYQPYRGPNIRSRLVPGSYHIIGERVQRQYKAKGKTRTRTVLREKYVHHGPKGQAQYDVYATEVKGLWPRYFFRDAADKKKLYDDYKQAMADAIARVLNQR